MPEDLIDRERHEILHALHECYDAAAERVREDGDPFSTCTVQSVNFKLHPNGLSSAYAVLQVGREETDRIGVIHVFQRALSPEFPLGAPQRPAPAAFLVHGAGHGFRHTFHNFAPWLAGHGVDVWGVDLRYVLVPETRRDLSFMAEWGIERMLNDVRIACRFARHARSIGGAYFAGKFHLVGQSLGGALTYAVAHAESQLPVGEQDIGGIIPVDTLYYMPPGIDPGIAQATANDFKQRLSDGEYAVRENAECRRIGEAARTDPQGRYGESPLTNEQAALMTISQLWLESMVPPPPAALHQLLPGHYASCVRDALGHPVDGRFSPKSAIIDFLADTVPCQPTRMMADFYGIAAAGDASPYIQHLADIRIPSFYIGAAGGYGNFGAQTNAKLVSSVDRAQRVVQLLPPEQYRDFFGHIECFTATQAPYSIWPLMLDWIEEHSLPSRETLAAPVMVTLPRRSAVAA